MPAKDKLGIWRSSDSDPEISCAETPLRDHLEFFSWLQLQFRFTCQHCKGWNQSCVPNYEKACALVEIFHSNCGISVAISAFNFTDLLSSFIDTNYLLALCSVWYNLKIPPFKRKYNINDLKELCYLGLLLLVLCYGVWKTGFTTCSWNTAFKFWDRKIYLTTILHKLKVNKMTSCKWPDCIEKW